MASHSENQVTNTFSMGSEEPIIPAEFVDQILQEFHKEEEEPQQPTSDGSITLEDFLVKRGVLGEPIETPSSSSTHQYQTYQGLQYNSNWNVVSAGAGGLPSGATLGYEGFSGDGIIGESSGFSGCSAAANGGFQGLCFDSGGGFHMENSNPITTNGLCGTRAGDSVSRYGVEWRRRGRRVDEGEEEVVDRTKKRMIRNRESAARSRARKLAQRAALEAEKDQLEEEVARLTRKLDTATKRRMKELLKVMEERPPSQAVRHRKMSRRTQSNEW